MSFRQGGAFFISVVLMAVFFGSAAAAALECKPKTAGYFTQLRNTAQGTRSPVELTGITRSLTGAHGDPQRGRLIMIAQDKGNCLACHRIAALSSEPSHGDIGPALNGVGARYAEPQLRQIIVNPKAYFQDTIMPGFHATEGLERVAAPFTGRPILTAAEVEDVVAFLKTLQ